jgi:hypothetical protein
MKKVAAPRLAVWLVGHLPYGRSEAVLGDLLERFAQGETVWWFWRQALCALAVSLKTAIKVHGPSFAAALIAWIAVCFAVGVLSGHALNALIRSLALAPTQTPWYERPLPFALMNPERFVNCVAYIAAGWAAVRIHRTHPRAIVTVFATLLLARRMPWMIELTHALITSSRYAHALRTYCSETLFTTLSILAPGFWAARQLERKGGSPIVS